SVTASAARPLRVVAWRIRSCTLARFSAMRSNITGERLETGGWRDKEQGSDKSGESGERGSRRAFFLRFPPVSSPQPPVFPYSISSIVSIFPERRKRAMRNSLERL